MVFVVGELFTTSLNYDPNNKLYVHVFRPPLFRCNIAGTFFVRDSDYQ